MLAIIDEQIATTPICPLSGNRVRPSSGSSAGRSAGGRLERRAPGGLHIGGSGPRSVPIEGPDLPLP